MKGYRITGCLPIPPDHIPPETNMKGTNKWSQHQSLRPVCQKSIRLTLGRCGFSLVWSSEYLGCTGYPEKMC